MDTIAISSIPSLIGEKVKVSGTVQSIGRENTVQKVVLRDETGTVTVSNRTDRPRTSLEVECGTVEDDINRLAAGMNMDAYGSVRETSDGLDIVASMIIIRRPRE